MDSSPEVKTYVLDTNVLMLDPDALHKFAEHRVVIPLSVVTELDNHKKDERETGRNARQAVRVIDKLTEVGLVDSAKSVNAFGGTLELSLTEAQFQPNLPVDLSWDVVDNRILAVALAYSAILVSNDAVLRIKARAIGVPVESYSNNKVNVEGLYTGHREGYLTEEDLNLLYSEGILPANREQYVNPDAETCPNQCITLTNLSNPKQSAIVRYDLDLDAFVLVSGNTLKPSGLTPKNAEQLMALDLLMNPDIKLVTLIGKAGCGKTLCALAAAMHLTLDFFEYEKILVARPIVPMGNDIGYLPGSMDEKLGPYMAPIRENVEFLMQMSVGLELKRQEKVEKHEKLSKQKLAKTFSKSTVSKEIHDENYIKDFAKIPGVDELVVNGKLEIAALTYIRGRSLPNRILIIDEAQNLTQHEIKTIVTRIGEGSKIILTGDIEQIDASYLDASNNGLSYLVDKFRGEKIAAHITLLKSERSELADIASRIL